MRYLVAPTTIGQVQVIDDVVREHDTDGADGIVVQVAEPELDQPEAFPACTYNVDC